MAGDAMIARILGGVCLALVVAVTVQTVSLKRVERALEVSKAIGETTRLNLLEVVEARQTEREQCAADFAGEVERGKAERAKAVAASQARALITGICPPQAKTQAQRNAALRANSGE
jgi:hypothetical protein